jgi:hypothetical protein
VWGAAWWVVCLWEGIEINNFTLFWDNLNRCEENEVSVEMLSVCYRNIEVIRGTVLNIETCHCCHTHRQYYHSCSAQGKCTRD